MLPSLKLQGSPLAQYDLVFTSQVLHADRRARTLCGSSSTSAGLNVLWYALLLGAGCRATLSDLDLRPIGLAVRAH